MYRDITIAKETFSNLIQAYFSNYSTSQSHTIYYIESRFPVGPNICYDKRTKYAKAVSFKDEIAPTSD